MLYHKQLNFVELHQLYLSVFDKPIFGLFVYLRKYTLKLKLISFWIQSKYSTDVQIIWRTFFGRVILFLCTL